MSPSCVATSPPAPQTHGYTVNSASPATATGILAASLSLIVFAASSISAHVVGGSTPAFSKTSVLYTRERTPAYQGIPYSSSS